MKSLKYTSDIGHLYAPIRCNVLLPDDWIIEEEIRKEHEIKRKKHEPQPLSLPQNEEEPRHKKIKEEPAPPARVIIVDL